MSWIMVGVTVGSAVLGGMNKSSQRAEQKRRQDAANAAENESRKLKNALMLKETARQVVEMNRQRQATLASNAQARQHLGRQASTGYSEANLITAAGDNAGASALMLKSDIVMQEYTQEAQLNANATTDDDNFNSQLQSLMNDSTSRYNPLIVADASYSNNDILGSTLGSIAGATATAYSKGAFKGVGTKISSGSNDLLG